MYQNVLPEIHSSSLSTYFCILYSFLADKGFNDTNSDSRAIIITASQLCGEKVYFKQIRCNSLKFLCWQQKGSENKRENPLVILSNQVTCSQIAMSRSLN